MTSNPNAPPGAPASPGTSPGTSPGAAAPARPAESRPSQPDSGQGGPRWATGQRPQPDDGAPDPPTLHEAVESMPDGPNVAPSPFEEEAARGEVGKPGTPPGRSP